MELRFSTWLNEIALKYGDRPAITCGQTVTYTQLNTYALRFAQTLIKAGVKKGDRVVLWAVNGIDWMVSFLGTAMAGGIAVLMNYGLSGEDVTQLEKLVGASWMVIGGNKVSAVDPAAAVKAALEGGIPQGHIFQMGDLYTASLNDKEELDMALLNERESMIQPRDTALIIYTTGTTSIPKAVQLSAFSVLSDVMSGTEIFGKDLSDKICTALPLFHSFGLIVTILYLNIGSQVFFPSMIKPDLVMELINEYQIGDLASVGAIYGVLPQLPGFDKKLFGKLKNCIVGGGFTTPTEMMRLENTFGGAKLLNGYGQTECSPVISCPVPSDPIERRAVTVGHPWPGLDVRIWRDGAGFLPQGEIGEIVVKGPVTMNGYYGLPEEQQPFDADGWLHTGDLGRITEDGLLQLAGRIKDIIIRSGENISPLDIEQIMMEEGVIRQVKVLGAPHPIWGESVEACVVLNEDSLDEEALRASLRRRLASYKIPSHFFIYPSFPLNANGKLDQRLLKADMLERLNRVFIGNALDDGLRVAHMQIRNRDYAITPVCDMMQGLAEQLGFIGRRAQRIRLAVEEMLTERIENAYSADGDIGIDVLLMPQWLRIRFTDSGKPYQLDRAESSLSAKIILANVDAYSFGKTQENQAEYCLDWQYVEDFDIEGYLLSHQITRVPEI